jgi:signal transduction histidine kinase
MPTADARFVRVEIFNTGKRLTHEEISNIFVPFYSLRPYGTGFGLPAAHLAARKNLGEIAFESLEGLGTRCITWLPVITAHDNGLPKIS